MERQYETVFILTPVLSEEQAKDTVTTFKKVLKDKGATIVHEEAWGIKKLAYPIDHKTTGIYHLLEFKGDPSTIAALELQYRRSDHMLRFSTVVLDKHGIAYAERRRQKLASAPA